MFINKSYIICICSFIFLINCSTLDKSLDYFSLNKEEKKLSGKRLNIISLKNDLLIDENAKNTELVLSKTIVNNSWNQIGGNSSHVSANYLLSDNLKVYWKNRVGDGEGSYNRIFAQPVGNKNYLFVLDAEGKLVCLNIENGKLIWEVDVFPESESLNTSIDGGLALKNNNVIISNSYGDIINVNAIDGSIKWKINNNKPAQGSPSIYNDYLFQMTIHNELFVYDINTGEEIWRYVSSFVTAISNGGTSPAINSQAVIFPSNTGELFALNLNTGSVIWNSNLVIEGSLSGTLDLTDIDSGPVIHNDLIFAGSLTGVFAAIDSITGGIIWDILLKTSNNPVINGNAVFIVSDEGKLINLLRGTGKIRWITDLKNNLDKDIDSMPVCRGPLLASNYLWLVCKDKKVFQVNAYDGTVKNIFNIDSPSNIAPIVIGEKLIFYTEDAEVITYR